MAAIEDLKEEEIRRLRREDAIKKREYEMEQRRHDEEERKRTELERMKQAQEEQLQQKQEARIRFMQKQAKLRAQRQAELDRKDKSREQKIKQAERAWLDKVNASDHAKAERNTEYLMEVDERREAARQARRDEEAKERAKKTAAFDRQLELDEKRHEAIAAREVQRVVRAAVMTDDIKNDAKIELESFVQNPAPVPLKQVVSGRLKPVPGVTQLLASLRDQREELEELEAQDIDMRAQLRNQSLFQYVHEIQEAASKTDVRPPQPVMADLARTGVKKAPISPGRKATVGRASDKNATTSPSATARRSGFGGFRRFAK